MAHPRGSPSFIMFMCFLFHLVHGFIGHTEVFFVFESILGIDHHIAHADTQFIGDQQIVGLLFDVMEHGFLNLSIFTELPASPMITYSSPP